MYIPEIYREEDPGTIRSFIREHPFGLLLSNGESHPLATHLPLELQPGPGDSWILESHMARANPQWKTIEDGASVLCIFNGPHAYISSSWYAKEEVPTWNYMAVHLTGTWRLQSETELWASLKRLVDRHESSSTNPVYMEGFSEPVLRQIRGIVGFEVHITRLEAAFKLSQGRTQDHESIRAALDKRGGMAAEISKRMR